MEKKVRILRVEKRKIWNKKDGQRIQKYAIEQLLENKL